jgi:AcrR family transcriptional regulator
VKDVNSLVGIPKAGYLRRMPRSADATRQRILDAAYAQFYRKGFARVGVDEIAEAAKVTKRTLYYHFNSKDELLSAVLDAQHALAVKAFRAWADQLEGNAEEMITGLFADFSKWSATPRFSGSGFTRLAMELADLPGHPARGAARRHKRLIEVQIAEMLAKSRVSEATDTARQIVLLLEGTNNLILIHGDRRYADAATRAAIALLGLRRRRAAGAQRPSRASQIVKRPVRHVRSHMT